MPLSVSTDAILEKNKISSSGVWLLLLEIAYPGETTLYLVYNNANITWNSLTWTAFDFTLGDVTESKDGSVPTVSLSVNDITRTLTPIIDDYAGGVGATATLRIVHSDHLDNITPELEEEFEIINTNIDSMNTITFSLGTENLLNYRYPQQRYLKNHCRYKTFKGTECGYAGAETECNRTFTRCKELENQTRFGGFPGVGMLGVFK